MSKDHSLHALVSGRVKFHYDIATQNRFVSVIEKNPTMVYYSRDSIKKELADRVDAAKYLAMKPFHKFIYMRGLIDDIAIEKKIERLEMDLVRMSKNGVRKFSLIDLTLI